MHYLTFLELNADNVTMHQVCITFTPPEEEVETPPPAPASVGRGLTFPVAKPPHTVSLTPIASYEVRRDGITYLNVPEGMDNLPGMVKALELDLSSLGHYSIPPMLNMMVIEMLTYGYANQEEPILMINTVENPSLTDYNINSLSKKYGLIVALTVLWATYWPRQLITSEYTRIVALGSVIICEGYSSQRFLLSEWKENPNMMTYDMMPVMHYRRMKVLNQVISSVSMKDDEFTLIFVRSEVDTHNPENRYLTTAVVPISNTMTTHDMLEELKLTGQMDLNIWRNRPNADPIQETMNFLRYLG